MSILKNNAVRIEWGQVESNAQFCTMKILGKRRVQIVVSGRVQGVCFRLYTVREAARLGLTGWVRNLRSGDVEVTAEGDEAPLQELERWCRQGPPHAVVDGVVASYGEATGEFTRFRNADEW